MMRLARMLVALTVLSGAAQAQTVAVRGGEHPGFTRLVLDLPAAMPWEVTRTGREAIVTLPRAGLSFDLDGAFARIPQTRLAALAPGPTPGALTLKLGCACTLDSFLHDGRMLVIDIGDPPESAPPARQELILPLLPDVSGRSEPPAAVVAPGLQAVLAPAESALARALSRAASQALLRPSGTPAGAPHGLLSPVDTSAATEASAPAPPAPVPPAPDRSRAAQVALRSPFEALPSPDAPADRPAECTPDRLLDVAAWSDGTDFGMQIGRHRTALYREFDRPDPGAAEALARLYLHMGFGAEARAILPLTKLSGTERAALVAMSDILDRVGTPAPDDRHGFRPDAEPAFAGQTGCPGAAALWAVLEGLSPKTAQIDTTAVRRAFQSLPLHLRRHLAPDLVARLRGARHDAAAADVLRAVKSLTPAPSTALDLARAEQAMAEGNPEEAAPILAKIAADGGPEGPQALAALIETQVAAGRPIDTQTAALAASHAREYRDQPLGPRLRRAHVLALTGAGELDAALQETARLPETDLPGVLGPLWQAIAGAADDADFLRRVLSVTRVPEGMPDDARAAVSARLLTLGLPEVAQAWLPDPEAADGGHTARLLGAEAALALGRATEAEVLLIGAQGREADLLRARARVAAGDHAGAARLYDALGLSREAARQRFLDGGPAGGPDLPPRRTAPAAPPPVAATQDRATSIAESGTRPRSEPAGNETGPGAASAEAPGQVTAEAASEPGAGPAPAAPSDDGVLARNRALIEESAATRQALEDLLAGFPFPAEPE